MQEPILLLHGLCCTGLIWSEFRGYFEQQGAMASAPTLMVDQRVRRLNVESRKLGSLRLSDYIRAAEDECRSLEARVGKRPIVVGHAMGALVAMKLAEYGIVSAAVLVTPAIPRDLQSLGARVLWSAFRAAHRLRLIPSILNADSSVIKATLFGSLPRERRGAAAMHLVCDSSSALADLGGECVDLSKIRVPLLVVGAMRDRVIAPKAVRSLARRLNVRCGADYYEYARHGHWLFAEPGWQLPARDIYQWLVSRVVPAETSASDEPLVGVDQALLLEATEARHDLGCRLPSCKMSR